MKITKLLLGIIFFFSPALCYGDTIQVIQWEDLIAQQYRTEDPLAHLSEEERGLAEWIIYLRQTLPEKITPKDEEFNKEMTEALPELKKKGIDVDQIIADRHTRDTSINKELNGKRIRLAGYLLPLDLSGKDIREFLLVPTIGACIHVPPPPPNQMVHATTKKPIKFDLSEMFRPIWATGHLITKSLSKELFMGDGTGNVDIGYVLQVETIEPYKEP